ncbi:alpha/beta fold hydrolase [Kribbella sp. NPDC048928]|uniref:alpha/beta fold hydrolase n=1 Tax=Kribbella sp. NPDC048928 TaxID=3364111 RepID=UPI00371B7F4C
MELDVLVDGQVGVEGRTLRFCLYGPADGVPVIELYGTPSTRLRRPDQVAAMEQSGVRVLMADRPGYGGSTRQPGRTVADFVRDVEALADSQGWERFAIAGGSGGGPHALACAALLPHRVTRCAVISGVRPQVVALPPEGVLRGQLAQLGADILGQVEAGGPEYPGAPPGPPAWDDPVARARLAFGTARTTRTFLRLTRNGSWRTSLLQKAINSRAVTFPPAARGPMFINGSACQAILRW